MDLMVFPDVHYNGYPVFCLLTHPHHGPELREPTQRERKEEEGSKGRVTASRNSGRRRLQTV